MATICIEEIHVHVLTVYSCTCTIIYYIHGNYRGDTCTCTNSVLQYIAVHVIMPERKHEMVDSNLFRSSKISGSRKLSNDHSSAKLFCNGVPVNRSLLAAL